MSGKRDERYPLNYWMAIYLLPEEIDETLTPVLDAIVEGDTKKAKALLVGRDDVVSSILYSQALRMEGKTLEVKKVLEGIAKKDFYVCHNLLRICIALSDFERAKEVLTMIVAENEEMKAILKNEEGLIFWLTDRYLNAKEIFEEGLRIAEKTGNSHLIDMFYNNIALIEQSLGNYERSLKLLQASLEISTKAGNTEGIVIAKLNIGEAYREVGDLNVAKNEFLSTVEILGDIGSSTAIG